ncbi:hypothetical protein [Aeribacillus composti]|uniref:hypothetical protein n=1 Tax=Aeribacillus composti TaxID=1868734 RepID=UPI003D1D0651
MSYRMLVLAKKIVSEMKDFYQVNEPIKVEKSDIETIEWLIEQAEKAERYKKALENIVISIFPLDIDDAVAIAKEALEGEK